MTAPLPPTSAGDDPPLGADTPFRTLVDRIGAIVWEAEPSRETDRARFTFVSEGTDALLGYPARRWLENPSFWFEITHPDDRERVAAEIRRATREGSADFIYRSFAADGREVWLRNIVQGDLDGPRLRGVVVDVSGRRAAEERLQRLQVLIGALSELLTPREVAAVVAEQGRTAVGANAVAVFVRDGDELEISGYDGYSLEDDEPYCRIPLSAPVPAAEAARTGEPLYLSGEEVQRRYPSLARGRRLAGTGQLVALPLVADGRLFGSLGLRMPGDRPLEEADRVVLDVLARACSQALLRAEQVAAEREARRSAEDANALLDTIIVTAPEGFALFDRDLRYVRVNEALARINGVPAEDHIGRTLQEIVPDVPAEGHIEPLRRVLETGEPVDDIEVTGTTAADPGTRRTWLLSFYPVRDAAGEIQWLGTFVNDITARKRAEEAAAMLAELGTILDEVVGVEDRIERLVGAVVPRLADICVVSLRTDSGRLERVAVRHADPGRETVLRDVPPSDRVASSLTGPVAIDEVDEERLRALGFSDLQVAALLELGLRSAAFVPLAVRDRQIGILSLGSHRPAAFSPADLELAAEVGRRAALAVDNARLFESERLARQRTAQLHAVAAALAEALTPDDVARVILGEVVPAAGASRGTVWQLSDDETALDAVGWRGIPEDVMDDYRQISLRARLPLADAVRSRTSIWLESRAAHVAAYPDAAADFDRAGSLATATVPLLSTGRAIGAMTLSYDRERSFSDEDRALVGALASQCAQALERARLYEGERQVAAILQRSLLPARLPAVDGVEIAVRYLPAAGLEAGGDFYEALPLPGGRIGIAVGDVVGRGATAAAAMGQLRSALRAFALFGEEPGAVLRQLSAFAETVDGAMAATAVFAQLDPQRRELRYACAGHPWPALIRSDGTADFLREGRGVPLGCVPDPVYAEAVVTLEPGSSLLLYTDGLTERRGEDITKSYERLLRTLAARHEGDLAAMLDEVVDEVGEDAPLDDVALLAVHLRGAAAGVTRLVYAADRAHVPAARAAVREWLLSRGADEEGVGDVLLACGEAVANAVEHAYRTGSSGTVEIELSAPEPDWVALTICDRGSWKEPVAAAHRGRGFALMRMLMHDVDVEHRPDGTTVRMRRRIVTHELPDPPERGEDREPCSATTEYGVATITGDIDLSCADALQEQLLAAAPEGEPLTIDLSQAGFLDSTGARMLLVVRERLGGRLIVVAPEGTPPRRALALSGLEDLLDVRG